MSVLYNRRYILHDRPVGDFQPSNLKRVIEPVPELGPGQALVRNRYLSIDPTNRVWMEDLESYLPPVALGEVMRGIGAGEVVDSRSKKYRVGAKVVGFLGWQDYIVVSENDEYPVQALPAYPAIPLTTALGVLGGTGMTAYFGMLDIGKPKRGETVVVSAAAGAVGSIAGQIAKIFGARVVGIAGTQEKCDWLTKELNFDAAVCRRDADWREQLAAACPKGVDVNFECVGGEILEAVMSLMNLHGRIVLCGLISQYSININEITGPRNFPEIVIRRLKIQGLIILDYINRFPMAQMRMMWWIKRGKIKHRQTLVHGLDESPNALVQLFHGENIGKLLVEIDEYDGSSL